MNSMLYAKKRMSFLSKLLVVLMIFSICMPSMPVHAGENDVTAYGFEIDNSYNGKWTTGNLRKTYAEGEWVAFQTEISNINWSLTDPNGLNRIGVEFDFYDIGRYFDLVRNVSVGLELLPDSHGFPATGMSLTEPSPGGAMPLGNEADVNAAQRDPNNPYEHYFEGFALINKTIDITDHMNIAMDGTKGTATDATRKFCVTLEQIKQAYWDEYGIDIEGENKIVLYFQLHLSRTWLWNNVSSFNGELPLVHAYTSHPTDKWGGYIYDEAFLTYPGGVYTMLGSSVYPGSSGHSYVYIITNDGHEAGKKTIPIPAIKETTGSISGYKFTDVNENKEYDEGVDIPLDGWDIYLRTDLYEILDLEFHTTTDINGYYEFINLPYNLIWELSEGFEDGYVQIYPHAGVPPVGNHTGNVETEWYKKAETLSNMGGYTDRFDYGWLVKLAPPDHLIQTHVNFINLIPGGIEIVKNVPNVEDDQTMFDFEIYADSSLTQLVASLSTSELQSVLEELLPGTYYVIEVPEPGYSTTTDYFEVVVVAGEVSTVTFINNYDDLEGGIRIYKDVPNVDNDPTQFVYEIYSDSGLTQQVTSLFGTESAFVSIIVPVGTYYVHEVPNINYSTLISTYEVVVVDEVFSDVYFMNTFNEPPETFSIAGYVFEDVDSDNDVDPGEIGYNGVTVNLISGSTVIASTVTFNNGEYLFTEVLAGSYTVEVSDTVPDPQVSEYDGTLDESVDVTVGPDATLINFGYFYEPPETFSIDGYVFEDVDSDNNVDPGEVGYNNVGVNLISGSTVIDSAYTDANGFYEFPTIFAGSYTVALDIHIPIQVSEYDGTLDESVDVTVGPDATLINFGYYYEEPPETYSIDGFVFEDVDENNTVDIGEVGYESVAVDLLSGSTVIASTVTFNSGEYLFTEVLAGSYTVEVSGTVPDTQVSEYDGTLDESVDVTVGPDATLINFGYYYEEPPEPWLVHGYVFYDENGNNTKDAGEPGFAGIDIYLDGNPSHSTTTDSNGYYYFDQIPGTSHDVVVTVESTVPADYEISEYDGTLDESAEVVFGSEYDEPLINFGYKNEEPPETYTFHGYVFEDPNADNSKHHSEFGYPDIELTLHDGSTTYTEYTDEGYYVFNMLELEGPIIYITVAGPSITEVSEYDASLDESITIDLMYYEATNGDYFNFGYYDEEPYYDIAIDKVADDYSVKVGDTITYTVTVTNTGNETL